MRLAPPHPTFDERSLERALDLAQAAAAFASPNPTVGCVLARSEQVLGEGAHLYAHRDHAEIAALKTAAAQHHDVRGATAYVTLEPCAHHGRTGPCADALVAAGIARCVVATVDPNPLVRGGGLAKLHAAGVTVDLLSPEAPLAQRARRLNDAFAFSVQHGRPFVTLKAALSREGRLAPPPASRAAQAPVWLTGPAARADVQQLRHEADALLTGIGTVLADDPQLTDRSGLPRRRPLLRIVLDPALCLTGAAALVAHAAKDVLIFCDATVDPARRRTLGHLGPEVEAIPDLRSLGGLVAVLQNLQARGLRSVLTEAGAVLNGALLHADLADRVVLYTTETVLGADGVPFAEGGPSPEVLAARLTSRTELTLPHGNAQDRRNVGYLHDPWTGI